MSQRPAPRERPTGPTRALLPQRGRSVLLRGAGKWAVLAVVGCALAAAIGPWVGRTAARLGPEGLGVAAVVIVAMWAGNRVCRFIAPPAPQPTSMARGVLRQPDELADMLWPAETKAAHEAGHATAGLVLQLEVVDVTLNQVELTAEAVRTAHVIPDQAWKLLVMIMAGRAGQERIGNHALASDSDNQEALRLATRLCEHRAELPVDYDSPENLVDLARTHARRLLEANATAFEAIKTALIDRGHLTADDLTAVVAAAQRERHP